MEILRWQGPTPKHDLADFIEAWKRDGTPDWSHFAHTLGVTFWRNTDSGCGWCGTTRTDPRVNHVQIMVFPLQITFWFKSRTLQFHVWQSHENWAKAD